MHTDLIHASSTYQSLHPKWHLDRFSHFCTAHGRESLYFRMAAPSALKIAPLQYMEVKEEAQDREGWRAKCQKPTGNSRRLERWGISTPSNTWFLGPTMVPWSHQSPQPKRHLDRFSRFCRAHNRGRQTDQ